MVTSPLFSGGAGGIAARVKIYMGAPIGVVEIAAPVKVPPSPPPPPPPQLLLRAAQGRNVNKMSVKGLLNE